MSSSDIGKTTTSTSTVVASRRSSSNELKGKKSAKKPSKVELRKSMSDLVALTQAAKRPLPSRFGSGVDRKTESDFAHTGLWTDVKALGTAHLWESIKTLWEVYQHKKKGGFTDDKTMIVRVPLLCAA